MKNLFKSLLIVFVVMTSSCTKESTNDPGELYPEKADYEFKVAKLPFDDQSLEVDTIIPKEFKFVYKNKWYSSPCVKDSNSVMIFSDPEVNDLLGKLKSIPTLAIEFGREGLVYFYDTEADRIKAAEIKSKTEILTRATTSGHIHSFQVVMWDKSHGLKYGGEYIEVNSTATSYNQSPNSRWVPNLHYFTYGVLGDKVVDFNDRISSVQMSAIAQSGDGGYNQYPRLYVTFYRDANYEGPSLTFSEVNLDYLYSYRAYLGSFDFDNKPTSFKIYCSN